MEIDMHPRTFLPEDSWVQHSLSLLDIPASGPATSCDGKLGPAPNQKSEWHPFVHVVLGD